MCLCGVVHYWNAVENEQRNIREKETMTNKNNQGRRFRRHHCRLHRYYYFHLECFERKKKQEANLRQNSFFHKLLLMQQNYNNKFVSLLFCVFFFFLLCLSLKIKINAPNNNIIIIFNVFNVVWCFVFIAALCAYNAKRILIHSRFYIIKSQRQPWPTNCTKMLNEKSRKRAIQDTPHKLMFATSAIACAGVVAAAVAVAQMLYYTTHTLTYLYKYMQKYKIQFIYKDIVCSVCLPPSDSTNSIRMM